MCGRFRLARKKEILEEHFGAECALDDADWAPRYNVAPGQAIAVVRAMDDARQDDTGLGRERRGRRLEQMRWGLIPWWAKELPSGYKMINARLETAARKPAFRDPLRARRCLIAADGFYEWKREGKQSLPYCITMADGSLFAFAGLWERWIPPAQASIALTPQQVKFWPEVGSAQTSPGQAVESCAIMTSPANELVADVHDRMPVILPPESYDLWLDPGFHNVQQLMRLLKPYPAAAMRRFRVSERVNQVRNDDAECAAEIGAA